MQSTENTWLDLFRSAFDTIEEGIFIIRRSGFKIVYANKKASRIFNMKPRELAQKTCHYILFNKLTKCDDCPIEAMYAADMAQVRDVKYVDYRSFQRNLVCRYSALNEEYFLMSNSDQTKEKSLINTITSQAKEMKAKNVVLNLRKKEVEKKQEFLTNVINGIREGIMVVDKSYRVELANQMLITVLGSSIEGESYPPCYTLAYQRSTPCPDCPMLPEHISKNVSARQIVDPHTKEEKNITVQFTRTATGLIESLRDTTKEKNLLTMIKNQQAQLTATNEQLEIAQQHIDEELRQVGELQHSLLPTVLPDDDRFDMATFYTPATQAGGDYYDFLEMSNGDIGILVADVSGHGLPAAVIMAMTRVIQRSLAMDEPSPAEALDKVNSMLCENIYTNDFVTMFYIILEKESLSARYSSAGHNPLIHYRLASNSFEKYTSKGFFLGAFDIGGYEEGSFHFEPGDILLLYTDGLVEAMNRDREQFGYDRVEAILREDASKGAQEIMDKMVSEVKRFADGVPFDDDMTMVVVKVNVNV
ncbi:SpoIIE family protein phosphatase [Chrysiogenes arsenatis]|uniref:SpoIIE family protein phosphatase n=1 Tax=Chrysiogenes arsenatis TaxID=309797 RepID=UPI000408E87D|nr:SpoIIE family protein phosphatase [Chrysiogenes arsenatis]